MPANITVKNQNVFDYIEKWRDRGVFKERTFSDNTQVEVHMDWSFKIWLFSTKIVEYIAARNEYIVKNWGWWSRTTSHDIRAYLKLLLGYRLDNWDIFTDNWLRITPEDYEDGYHMGRRWIFNPTALVFKRTE